MEDYTVDKKNDMFWWLCKSRASLIAYYGELKIKATFKIDAHDHSST